MEESGLVWDGACGRVRAARSVSLAASSASPTTLQAGCHCGKVRFSVAVDLARVHILDCNCSICAMVGYLHLTVPKHRVSISPDTLACMTTYTFNSGVAQHTFCPVCGVKPLYTPRSNPDCYAVNLRCVRLGDRDLSIVYLDGRNFTGTLDVE